MIPKTTLRSVLEFCKTEFFNDGAEGEAVHHLIDALEELAPIWEGPTDEKFADLMTEALAKITMNACRQGEKDDRSWPTLTALEYRDSWKEVGEFYAKELVIRMAAYLMTSPLSLRFGLAEILRKRTFTPSST